ncbi:MAG: signal recognition particle-docking protein FtsY [Actinobacteria bacterium]|nr:signal recognition particle-docking protein FtsY [Actinomycetota bacterium]
MQKLIKNINLIWNKFKKTNQDFWEEIEEQFILNDVSAATASDIIEEVKRKSLMENINDIEIIRHLLKEKIKNMLTPETAGDLKINVEDKPVVWMLVGVNGVGKTSTIAKLANYFKNIGTSVLLTAADTFRAAAYEQINHFAELLNLPIVHHQRHSDPGAVVYDSIEKAIAKNIDIVLIDTAGRMHTSYNLMEELKKIKKVINKKINREPDEILIVVDSTTGQNAKAQVAVFNEALSLTGIILTKTDGTSKGGVLLTISNEMKIPVKFITSGEKIDNISNFDPANFTEMLFS